MHLPQYPAVVRPLCLSHFPFGPRGSTVSGRHIALLDQIRPDPPDTKPENEGGEDASEPINDREGVANVVHYTQ
jgi:hypothetical protein